jgi:(1->4)-alpha-D-glucan 1-alpha-D-glucosylmutase
MVAVPNSTYRVQLGRGFGFAQARLVVSYLAQLGVTACYLSPCVRAKPGSTHGYDICDHNAFNSEIGSDEDHAILSADLAAQGIGQILDFVPNHMSADEGTNAWWRDVLENGPCASHAPYFDIDWQPVKVELAEKVLLPILGDQYGRALERGELQLRFCDGTFTIQYFEHNLPVNPRQTPRVLLHDIEVLNDDLGAEHPQVVELLSVATALRNLPAYTETDPVRVAERRREKEVARERLLRLVGEAPRIAEHIGAAVTAFNGRPGEPRSFDHLHALLEAQPYRLAYWRTAAHEINYRRFFDINGLVGLRVEEREVFDATHVLLLRVIAQGRVTGVRLDHIDGLFDPLEYLTELHSAVREACGGVLAPYVVVEKILSANETLPAEWPVAGTTGYDFLNDVNGVFVDRGNARTFVRIFERFTRCAASFPDVVYAGKKAIMEIPMASELNVLAHALNRISERDRRTRDFTLNSLREALREVVASFPVYRTYVTAARQSDDDRAAIASAIAQARRRNPTMEPSIFDFVADVLLPDAKNVRGREQYDERLQFAMKFQQYTGPVQAKGVEDTAFYRYNVLLSLNEVGGDPCRFGRAPEELHAANAYRLANWPLSMLATATHDTKRGEDARARLNALSELPQEWRQHLSAWGRINASNRTVVEGRPAPDRGDEYLFYQTLLGAWPPHLQAKSPFRDAAFIDRLRRYMLKAVREAKVHTSWLTQNTTYEDAVTGFVEGVLTGPTAARFFQSFAPFQSRIARLGMVNSLAQLVLKVASPGVPDFYQGTELWDFSLVDPDNRGAVDFDARVQALRELEPLLSEGRDRRVLTDALRQMTVHWRDGRIKLFVTTTALRLRRQLSAVFLHGTYAPLFASGEHNGHVIGIHRAGDGGAVIAVVPRLAAPLTTDDRFVPVGREVWGDTRLELPPDLAGATLTNAFTGEELRVRTGTGSTAVPLGDLLKQLPVGLFIVRHG